MSLIHMWNSPPTNEDAAGHLPFRWGTQPQPAPYTQPTQTSPLKASMGHSDGAHLSTEPSSTVINCNIRTPSQIFPGWSTWKPRDTPDSSMAGSPQEPQTHGQMVCTQSNEQQVGLERYLPSEPAIPLGWSASKNWPPHNLYQLRASLFGSDMYFRNVKLLRKVWW